MDFIFPTNDLKLEDYSPVQVVALKDYYKTQTIDESKITCDSCIKNSKSFITEVKNIIYR